MYIAVSSLKEMWNKNLLNRINHAQPISFCQSLHWVWDGQCNSEKLCCRTSTHRSPALHPVFKCEP